MHRAIAGGQPAVDISYSRQLLTCSMIPPTAAKIILPIGAGMLSLFGFWQATPGAEHLLKWADTSLGVAYSILFAAFIWHLMRIRDKREEAHEAKMAALIERTTAVIEENTEAKIRMTEMMSRLLETRFCHYSQDSPRQH